MKTKNFSSLIKSNLLFIVLILQPILDILSYIQKEMPVSFSGILRLLFTLLIPVYALIFSKDRKKLIITLSIFAVFSALHILNGFRLGYGDLFLDVKYILLVMHALLLFFSFMFLYEKEDIIRQIKAALPVILLIITATYYLSFFLKSGLYTYVGTTIGWTGWNNIPNVFSIVVASLFPFAAYFCIYHKKKWALLFLIPISFTYILNGTKTAYLTLIFTLLGFLVFVIMEFFVQKKDKFPLLVSVFLAVLIVCSVLGYPYSPRYKIDTLNLENLQNSEAFLSGKDPEEFVKLLDKKMVEKFGKERVLAAYKDRATAEGAADVRLRKIIYASLVWEDTDTLTKFVGFEQGAMQIDGETYDLESDLPALYFYYGYIGFALYMGLVAYFWLRLIKHLLLHFKESFTPFNMAIFLSYGLLMVSAAYTGYLFRKPSAAIYLAIVFLLIYCRTEPLLKKQKEKK